MQRVRGDPFEHHPGVEGGEHRDGIVAGRESHGGGVDQSAQNDDGWLRRITPL